MKFLLTDAPIDPPALMAGLADPGDGACATFEGRVRNENGGRSVLSLEYEAFAPLAEKEGARILAEAAGKFRINGAVCVHRTGHLELGEIAVWVAVTAGHRGPAFEACRYIIDEAKARVPIWKKEHYADGASEWINSAAPRSRRPRGAPGRGGRRALPGSASARQKRP
jgi:molybdopterin synthase catalytic subunit